MAGEGQSVEVPLGSAGVVRLRMIPRASLRIGFKTVEITKRKTTITLSGSATNLPSSVPARFEWIVQKENAPEERIPVAGVVLDVKNGAVTANVPLDVYEARLFGKGTVTFRLEPDFPYCETVLSGGTLTFNHPLGIRFPDGFSNARIGAKARIVPSFSPIFDEAMIELVIRERDVGTGEVDNADDTAAVFAWSKGDKSERVWRIGCKSAEGAPVLNYMEPDEAGGYEFEYLLKISADGGNTYQALGPAVEIASVPQPKLESFEIVTTEPDWIDNVVLWVSTIGSDTPDIPIKDISVKGKLTGYHPDLDLPVLLSLWRVEKDGKIKQFKDTEVSMVLANDGTFAAELYDFFSGAHRSDLTGADPRNFFVVLRLPEALTGGKRAPLLQVFAYDDAAFVPFLDGEGTVASRATGVCTKGAKLTITNDGLVHSSAILVGGKPFVDWFNAEIHGKDKTLFPNPMKAPGFKKIFDQIEALTDKKGATLNEVIAHMMIMYNELGGSFEPRSEDGGPKYCFEDKYRKGKYIGRSYNGYANRYAGDQLKAWGKISSDADVKAWNGKVWPADQPASVYKEAEKCDFYKFRGRGINQLTWHDNYKICADPPLLKHPSYKKKSDDLTGEQLDQAFTDPAIYVEAFRRYNANKDGVPAALTKVIKGEFKDYGTKVGGSGEYGALFEKRCKKVIEAMTKAGFTL